MDFILDFMIEGLLGKLLFISILLIINNIKFVYILSQMSLTC